VFDEADQFLVAEEFSLDPGHRHLGSRGEAHTIAGLDVAGALRDPVGGCHRTGRTASIAATTSSESGVVVGRKRATTPPSGATKNFSKFHSTSPASPTASPLGVSSR